MYSKRINNTRFNILKEDITKVKSDVIFTYTTPTLTEGDEVFVNIHREAGSNLFKDCQLYLTQYGKTQNFTTVMDSGSVIITNSGFLQNTRLVCHIVLNKVLFPSSLSNAFSSLSGVEFIRKFSYPEISEVIYGKVSDKDIQEFYNILIRFSKQYNIKEINIVCSDDESLIQYKKVFTNITSTWYEKILIKIFGEK